MPYDLDAVKASSPNSIRYVYASACVCGRAPLLPYPAGAAVLGDVLVQVFGEIVDAADVRPHEILGQLVFLDVGVGQRAGVRLGLVVTGHLLHLVETLGPLPLGGDGGGGVVVRSDGDRVLLGGDIARNHLLHAKGRLMLR